MRLLIADDAPAARAAFARVAERLGHEIVAEAEDAACAAELGLALRPDAAVVDGRLPPDGALGVVATLSGAGVATLVVAALDERELVRACTRAGACGAILRPFLRSHVRDALAGLARTT